jgi:CHASE2 domain-containing sensor protein
MRIMKRVLPYMAIFLIVSAVYLAGMIDFVDRGLTDLKFRVVSSKTDPAVVMVAVDSTSLLELEVWPWPDRTHAVVLCHERRRRAFGHPAGDGQPPASPRLGTTAARTGPG